MTDGPAADRSIVDLRVRGILPVIEIPDGIDPIAVIDALADGGITGVEITLRTTAGLAAIRAIRRERPEILVAAGTVRTPDEADAAIDAGAALLVSPGFSARVVDRAIDRGTPVLPGVCTPTEILLGMDRGIETFKFFPAEAAGGPRFLAAMGGPFPSVHFVPTGGIDAANLAAYLALPNVLACGGSWMVAPPLLAGPDLASIRRLSAEATAIVRGARAGAPAASSTPAR
jgi:2-dehydro-3-deoxyphosphogluconate aldolase/(4S)-4-hydroxy-2-oxoglutarate aldolase